MLAAALDEDVGGAATRAAGVIASADFPKLVDALRGRGYTVIGPTVRHGAIVYAEITHEHDLPVGWTDHQEPGIYRLQADGAATRFAYAVGPTTWKRYLYPPVQRLWRAERHGDSFDLIADSRPVPKYAFLGVRPCDLHALAILDKIYLAGLAADPEYAARRENALIIAVQCTAPAATCFCASLGTGPVAPDGYDLALTELTTPAVRYLVGVGSVRGAEILADVPHRAATRYDIQAADRALDAARAGMVRAVKPDGLHDRLQRTWDYPYWDDVAARCLTCGNCTQVCPTCFCVSIEDSTDLSGRTASRSRRPESCFTTGFSYVAGGSIRVSARARYRQWLMHKFVGWIDQFGTLGCVGCGRCITWCPAAIDLTAEVAHLTQLAGQEDDSR